MSPLVVGPGYTRNYVDGKVDPQAQVDAVVGAHGRLAATVDTMVIEGTGHVGVGSIISMNNARVASLLGADAVLVANGGLGSAYDELELQRVLMKEHGVKVRGVILNCVRPEKLGMVSDYFGKLLKRDWGVPLLGCVPDYSFLGHPTLADLEDFFGG
jgi:dethiobiotin synthetase